MLRLIVTAPLVVSGCVDHDASPHDDTIDRHLSTSIEVDTVEPPSLIAYRAEGSTTWRVPTRTGPGRFELHVDGPYRLTVVCDEVHNGFVSVRQVARTTDDERAVKLPCDTLPSPHRVTGTMAQAGRLFLGAAGASSRTPDWEFELAADRGTHALVALTGDRIAVRRPITVTHETAITPPIDLQTEGDALVPVTLTPTNLDGTELVMRAVVALQASDTTALIHTGPLASTKVAPSSVLAASDVQEVTVTVHNAAVGRTVTRPFRVGDPTTFPLPEALGPVAFDDLTVTWSTLPAFDVFELELDAFSFETFTLAFHQLVLSRRFIEATGVTQATIETAIPSFRTEWQFDTTQEYHRFAGVLRELANGDVVGSDVSEVVNGAARSATGQPPTWRTSSIPRARHILAERYPLADLAGR